MPKMSPEELVLIKNEYDRVRPLFIRNTIIYSFIPVLLVFFLPKILLPKKRGQPRNFEGDGITNFEDSGILMLLGIFLIVLIGVAFFFNLKYGIWNLRKDLTEKRKIITQATISSLELYSDDEVDLYFVNDNKTYDSLLLLKEDRYGLGKLPFNRSSNPEFVNAEKIEIVFAEHSRIIYNYQVIS